ncbi:MULTISPECIES: bifunctional TVP38/TMEM64 family protein/FAD-dependent oxidoreductase [Pseudoalteromonas]|uniref:FAD-dependent oxidoreductase n=1 Tax=Pseudoalteromonas TaxID=53246 RepID=UPI0002CCA7BC|nr:MULTISPECIES: bifunctional TVP38/TMEM64 family protein/FAD-dependent oxidoreductase [Pseudoalteromonas]MCP4059831.1 FAD-dependent oxidoreductase [Pseudoalteromonas sp.]ENN96962.1 mercuric reductase (Hg(II) reductase) [Pseudoalteromonas agarivorans S816]MDI3245741.1 FAD-dependent oxidoreductase [Pseudoalteromonas agarivorans]TMS68303.1 pyridine nucleotide-disulfide oxidoreductase [Pseudoalteromonas sp. S1691]TMS69127.1 pyridine nucleotide-disulfide oxidoreductase [Pseudoalteromonas sp. S1731
MIKKLFLVLIAAAAIGLFFHFNLHQLLTLEGLKGSMDQFSQYKEQSPLLVFGGFFLLYVVVTALSLPGAAILTLAAGALFGLVEGLLVASFASTVGATLAFLVSRYLLRDTIKQRFPERLDAIDAGVEKEGGFYLFTLRLVPVFPFFLINLLMGVTAIKAWTFYWVSQIGMLAGTFVFVNAGTQLAQIESLSGILSLDLILSFALLGVFPFIAKGILNVFKKRRVYKNYTKPKKFDRNMIVIGAGAGGLVTSYIAAAVKAKVTLIEAGEMGGDCLNYGCVPSKAVIKSAKIAEQIRHGEHYGLENMAPQFSFKKVMARVHQVIADIAPHDSVERYTNLGVDVVKGYGKLLDPWTVEIKLNDGGTQTLTARTIVIATGARPFVPPLPGIEETGYVTSDTLWTKFAELEEAPKKLVVLGGGPIGSELAQSFARLGSNVTQIEMAERIMIKEDLEVSTFAHEALIESGVNILTSHQTLRCEARDGKKFIVVKHNDTEIDIEYDELLCAVGRSARLKGYGLEELGIETNRTVVTNEYLETLYPNIFAAGDIVGPYQFTHVAAHQGWYAAVNGLFGNLKKFKVDYRVIPWTTFIDPEVARVGLNEQDAIDKGIDYEITRFEFEELDRAITDSATKGFIKVITPKGKDKILGVTVVSEHAGDLIAEFVLAMKHGLGLNKILGTIHSYPTWAEGNKYAAGEWKRAHAPEKVLNMLEKYHTWRRG